ncbi:trans-sulfuration enzyme family protein [Legionella gresilensis]|uniref:trans-sulfuration enzyme family protein n=1 Tax=Legionella gresilensis TaxID=91823 RepID=UPI0010419777|nr:PLP-dependent aspartate aminotransferase family protein [Legionella gresilensis]
MSDDEVEYHQPNLSNIVQSSWQFASPPIYRGSTVFFDSYEAMSDENVPYVYGRWGTPTADAFCKAMTELEGGAGTIVTCSGLAAISTILLALTYPGSHVLIGESSFPAALRFCDEVLKKFGVIVEKFSGTDITKINEKILPSTVLVYIDLPGSYGANFFNLLSIKKKSDKTYILVDNTWATPLFFNPLKYGADIVVHSTSKYIAGHSDSIMGCITVANLNLFQEIQNTSRALGQYAGADDLSLAIRGLKTLELRMRQHFDSALKIATWLTNHTAVEKVFYAALLSDENYQVWSKHFKGAGGVLTFFFKRAIEKNYPNFLNKLKIIKLGWGWGGYETLASASTINFGEYLGRIAIRLSVGLESTDNILKDLELSLKTL